MVSAPPAQHRITTPEVLAADARWDGAPAPAPRPLDLIYLIPHHNLTGGLKILLEHIRRLRARGHRVRAAYRGRARRAIPEWSDVETDGEIVHPPERSIGPALRGADAAVIGWYQWLFDAAGATVPLVYFEQGHETLFGDVRDDEAGRAVQAQFDAAMRLPVPIASVSEHVAGVLRRDYGRRTVVWPNGIDLTRFQPDGHLDGLQPGRKVLLVGNAALPFKAFRTALEALATAWNAGSRFEVTWVSQAAVEVGGIPFPLRNVVSPPQHELPAIYRSHDLFLFTSRYEAFPLPPIEAMASGVPVVATQCGGIATYALAGHDAVLCPVGDVGSLAKAIRRVLADPAAARLLSLRGRAAAERFSWDAALSTVERTLRQVISRPPPGPEGRP